MRVAMLGDIGPTGWRFDTDPVEDPPQAIRFAARGIARSHGA